MVGKDCVATVYDRAKLKAGNRIAGPAIVMEMDSTSVILPQHHGTVDPHGNILIYPDAYKASKAKAGAAKPKAVPVKARRAARKNPVRKAK
jgi:N-methylhydantoinase A